MPALETAPSVHQTVVSDRREPVSGIVVLGCQAPALAHAARPGQFVMVVPPGGERTGTALGIYEAGGERISLMVATVGPRTRELAELAPGAKLDMLGPLGNGFDVDALARRGPHGEAEVALVAGGVGLAPLLLAARRLLERGAGVRLYYGARTASALVEADIFSALGVEVELSTDDGSRGYHGFVTELLGRDERKPSAVAACGPSPMLRAVSRAAQRLGLRAQLSLEETFACGVGACWGCVVPLERTSAQAPPFPPPAPGETRDFVHARICKEGPVFWADELRW
ncbi:MAG: dihydroorotate dehydrogenase electron transfer subunit [Vulcanimicrobiaceae bacterium]